MISIVNRPVIVIGGGGHAKVVVDVLRLMGCKIVGLIDPNIDKGSLVFGIEVLGGEEQIKNHSIGDIQIANGLGTIPGKNIRWKLQDNYEEAGYEFISILHPSSIIAEDVDLAKGVQIMAGVVVQPGVSIGKGTILNTHASVDHDCVIGTKCHIAPSVTLSGNVTIGDRTHVGVGATVIQGVSIGECSVVGAGGIVLNHLNNNVKFVQRRENTISRYYG